MGLFRKGESSTHGRGWVAAITDSFHTGGVTHFEGGAPVPISAGRRTINGVSPHVAAIWNMYGAVAEFHSDAQFIGAILSRCSLRLGVLDVDNKVGPAFGDDGKPLEDVPVRLAKMGAKLIASLRSAPGLITQEGPVGGHSMILGGIGRNLAGPAECYLTAKRMATGDHWEVLSTVELVPIPLEKPGDKQRFKRRRFASTTWEEWTPDFYLRIFIPHPMLSGESDSAAVPLMSTLERLALLNSEGLADSKSRLTRGVYWIASEADFPATDDDPDGDQYMTREFIKTASTAIQDQNSAARQVPLVARAPLDVIKDGIRHDTFEYDGERLIEKRAAAVGDLARGMPLPYESTVGYGEASFANAFAIDEQLVRIYAMPLLDLITGFLTAGWFTSALMLAAGQKLDQPPSEDIQRLCVWYDVSGLVNAPDPAKLAQWAYGTATNPNKLISAKGARRLVGIPDNEAPTDEEFDKRVEEARQLRARSEKGGDEARPDADPDDPAPEDRQDGERDKDEEIGKRVVAVAGTVIELAVAQAGNKLRSKVAKRPDLLARIDGVDAADVARVLGPAVVESLGGTGPLLNGTFVAFERTVLREFVEAGRADAADLATAATNMAKRATLARLSNPAARLDAKTAHEFLELLLTGDKP